MKRPLLRLILAPLACSLAGCSGGDPAPLQSSPPRERAMDANRVLADAPSDGTPMDGAVSGAFSVSEGAACAPFGYPITFFETGVFGLDTLVSDTVNLVSADRCAHEQVIDAPVGAWASLAYATICQGGDDPSLCGAQATRSCSVNLIVKWAEERTESVSVTDPTLGFTYTVAPQGRPARIALDRRALAEATALETESEAVLRDHAAGTRHCPQENYDDIAAAAAAIGELRRKISSRLEGLAQ